MFPGGGVDHNESAVSAAKREAVEESDHTVTGCTPAHEPTMQIWPPGYAESKGNAWAKGYTGGLTYWMTGSASRDRIHPSHVGRHPDFEEAFEWKPIEEVLGRLAKDVKGDWAEDAKTRMTILKTYQQMHERQKEAAAALLIGRGINTPVLGVTHG